MSMAHLEIISEDGRPLPITEIGYKSHLIGRSAVENMGGPELCVDAWFAHEMTTTTGKQNTSPSGLFAHSILFHVAKVSNIWLDNAPTVGTKTPAGVASKSLKKP